MNTSNADILTEDNNLQSAESTALRSIMPFAGRPSSLHHRMRMSLQGMNKLVIAVQHSVRPGYCDPTDVVDHQKDLGIGFPVMTRRKKQTLHKNNLNWIIGTIVELAVVAQQTSWGRIGAAVTQHCCVLMFFMFYVRFQWFSLFKKGLFLTVFRGLVALILSISCFCRIISDFMQN